MQEFDFVALPNSIIHPSSQQASSLFFALKRGTDILVSLLLLPFLLGLVLILAILNPIMNKGPLIFAQIRMGRECKPFVAYKFRTMSPGIGQQRKPFDPVETYRICALGHLLRRSRIDELPQIINVLKGDMSLIGPRPDYILHARHYCRHIPGYRARYRVRPGITGLAQTQVGYATCHDTITAKVRADIQYLNNLSMAQEARIICWTAVTVITFRGQ